MFSPDEHFKTFDDFLEESVSEEYDKSNLKSQKHSIRLIHPIREKIEDIKYWYVNLFIFDLYYNIKNGIKNFWKYRNIIWKDRWYDYQFIFIILEFKLKYTIDNWDKAHYIGSHFTKLRMRVLLNRIEEYQTNLDNLQELYFSKKIDKEEYLLLKDKLLNKTWKSLGRNISRFWD